MARSLDEPEAARRLEFYLELEGRLIQEPSPVPLLH